MDVLTDDRAAPLVPGVVVSARRPLWRRVLPNLALLAFGTLVSLLLLEVVLRLWSPWGLRVWGDRLVLPANVRRVLLNHTNPRLESEIVFTKNSIGFRGPELPADPASHLTVIAVGGSTTECIYLSDGKDWPLALAARLQGQFPKLWINNAGLDGHSTFGHRLLVRQRVARLRPKVVLYLIGINDVERTVLKAGDRALTDTRFLPLADRLARYSSILANVQGLRRRREAERLNLPYREVDLATTPKFLPGVRRRRRMLAAQGPYLESYRARAEELLRVTRASGMDAVFLTQPALYGPAIDDVTGRDLATIEVDRERMLNGQGAWELLERYNDVTRDLGHRHGVLVIDVARQMPKSSRLFYDFLHFTTAGADEVARITARELCPFLARAYPEHAAQACAAP
jgi:lysophospholipase L1-like esterase